MVRSKDFVTTRKIVKLNPLFYSFWFITPIYTFSSPEDSTLAAKTVSSYDSKGNNTIADSYTWDTGSSDWIISARTCNYYSLVSQIYTRYRFKN